MADEKSFQELQNLVQRSVIRVEPASQKVVLMLQPSKAQGQIWQAALASQGVTVIWEPGNVDPAQLLEQMKLQKVNLPDCLLVDTEALGSNPYAFCRWCRTQHPDIRVVLISSGQREVSLPEHHWAVYQGAQDLLPGLRPESLLAEVVASVSRLLVVLNWPPLQQVALETALAPFLSQAKGNQNAGLSPFTPSGIVAPPLVNQPDLTIRQPTTLNSQSIAANSPEPPKPQSAPSADGDKSDKPSKKRTYRGVAY